MRLFTGITLALVASLVEEPYLINYDDEFIEDMYYVLPPFTATKIIVRSNKHKDYG